METNDLGLIATALFAPCVF
ncbi:hypothetical protein [Acaryochloris marina]